ncbi:MAG: hypothetical protein QE263_01890 [Vampirovibrionales bacterium]|nr:hypothetical protein [Vampirovibrionales bacterium]
MTKSIAHPSNCFPSTIASSVQFGAGIQDLDPYSKAFIIATGTDTFVALTNNLGTGDGSLSPVEALQWGGVRLCFP